MRYLTEFDPILACQVHGSWWLACDACQTTHASEAQAALHECAEPVARVHASLVTTNYTQQTWAWAAAGVLTGGCVVVCLSAEHTNALYKLWGLRQQQH